MQAVRLLQYCVSCLHILTGTGLGVLFGKLQQGVQENTQILTVTRMRADAEEIYGNTLGGISPAAERITGGFTRDEGASVRKVRYESALEVVKLSLKRL